MPFFTNGMKYKVSAFIILLIAMSLASVLVRSEIPSNSLAQRFPFSLGLDLVGGTELTYKAHTEKLSGADTGSALQVLRDVIEKRVNVFGVGEPIVQIESARTLDGTENRLLVELPGITNIDEAVKKLGETPTLDFYLAKVEQKANVEKLTQSLEGKQISDFSALFAPSGLTGQYLTRAQVEFQQTASQPMIAVTFNTEGTKLLEKITSQNIGNYLAIVLDGTIQSVPRIQSDIPNGQAVLTGQFTIQQAQKMAENLNYGALPVPIELIGTETIGPTLGANAMHEGTKAGLIGTIVVMLFLIIWYRLPGVVASLALSIYIVLSLLLFKLIPVTLTAAGIAGFVLSIGMAVDANILIFERTKEELARGRSLFDALHEGFHRAWLSIRDSNIASMITAVILFWVGTSAIKGFALTFGLGVAVSMFTALTLSRTFLFAIVPNKDGNLSRFLFSAGFNSGKQKQN
ncbi:MAG: protein translocase subunit SecD [Minisyncoccia bacterium]